MPGLSNRVRGEAGGDEVRKRVCKFGPGWSDVWLGIGSEWAACRSWLGRGWSVLLLFCLV